MSNKPNILFITADQWRGDCLGAVGHPVVKTPHIDAFAQEGTLFTRHYAAAAPCSPARAAMYSGLWQMNNRVVSNGTPMAHDLDNMARAARRGGYVPTLFGFTDITADPRVHDPNDPALKTYEGVLPGFEVEQALLGNMLPWTQWLRSHGYSDDVIDAPFELTPEPGQRIPNGPTGFAAEHSLSAFLVGRLIEWLGGKSDEQPWFAHLSLINPHPPFAAPMPYNAMYDPEDGPDFLSHEAEIDAHPIYQQFHETLSVDEFLPGQKGKVAELKEMDLRRIRATYYGMITEVDAQIGRLFEALKSGGVWDNTVIILTSDHAEMMGDHGLLGKGGFFPQSQHIPLIIRMPGSPQGQICKNLTSAVDLFPTMLEVMEIAPQNSLDGHSLITQLQNAEQPARQSIFWEFDYRSRIPVPEGETSATFGRTAPMLARLCDDSLQIRSADVPDLLFDLKADPNCQHNALNDPSARALRVRVTEALIHDLQQSNMQTFSNLIATASGMKKAVT
jgi:arylsulfatase A-like enzyme